MLEGFEIGQWSMMDNYKCKLCPWAGLDREDAIKHRAGHYPLPEQEVSGLFNADGKPIGEK